MGVSTFARALRTGLVALLLVLACIPGSAQESRRSGERETSSPELIPAAEPTLKDLEEIEKSNCRRRYGNPLNLLFLLPGVLFFTFALVTRRYRKVFPFIGLLFLLGSAQPDSSVRKAEESFASGRYLEALEIYRRVQRDLPYNSAVFYNLGIVSHYLEQPGYAVHYLRRSLRLDPGDRQARGALIDLERDYELTGQVAPPFPVDPDIAFLMVLVFTNATFVLGAFVVRTKKVRFLISLVLVAIMCLGSLAFFLGRLLAESRSVGVVVSREGEMFRVPEEDSRSWFDLPEGTSLWIRGKSGSYYLVQTPSRIEGWVRSDTILLD